MNPVNDSFLEKLEKTHESLDWLEEKIEANLKKLEQLENCEEENEEEINQITNDLDFLMVQLGNEKEHVEKLYRDFLAQIGKIDPE